MHVRHLIALLLINLMLSSFSFREVNRDNHEQLVVLYKTWRAFEQPPLKNGAPDYTQATFVSRMPAFKKLKGQLLSMDTTAWTIEQQADWHLLMAEMNGFDFNFRILKPWERDPAFYKSVWTERSDVPAHEGPTHHMITELWNYNFPLSSSERNRLIGTLKVIAPLNEQAKINLTGNARELWIAGIRDIKTQVDDLKNLINKPGVENDKELIAQINQAIQSTIQLVQWLEQKSVSKNGPSGIGKENYNWYLKNVHLVPLTWDDQVMLLKRELDRAWTALKMEEHRNRKLPQLREADSPESYKILSENAAKSLIEFLNKEEMITVKDYFKPALDQHLGSFIPKDRRNFFYITSHLDPRPLFSHFYHWFELAQMDNEPHSCELRRTALLYNIFDSRNEGMSTAVEELFMQGGLYDDSPRSKEIVYILIAQRAARGLGSLYAHANLMTMEEAGNIHMEYTPRGWMKTEKELRIFEQHLYMRQPGYGTSYITGKYLIEHAIATMAKQQESKGETFSIRRFLDRMNAIGDIPVTLAYWELTGDGQQVRDMFKYSTEFSHQTCATKGNYPLPEISQSARNKMHQDLNLAIANLEKNPNGLNELIWAGRRTAYLGNYYEAIDYFSKAITLHPESAEPYRHRGHRWITLRCYDKAISDLTIAAELTKGKTDVVELDGMPNDKNIPTSTLQSNIWYHLGLAYYLTGDYNKAVDAFKSCFEMSTNPDMFIATANWYNNSLRKAGKISEADLFLKKINPNVELIENHDYLRILKLYIDKQEITDPIQFLKNEAGLGAASYGYGLGVYLLFKGEKNKANLVFNHILSLKQWGAFGYIAAEAEK